MPSNVAVRRIARFFARSPFRCVRSVAISVSIAPVSGQFYKFPSLLPMYRRARIGPIDLGKSICRSVAEVAQMDVSS